MWYKYSACNIQYISYGKFSTRHLEYFILQKEISYKFNNKKYINRNAKYFILENEAIYKKMMDNLKYLSIMYKINKSCQ